MDNNQLLEAIIELNKSVSELHTDVRYMREDLAEHNASSKETKKKVEALNKDIDRAKGGIAVVGVLTTLITLYKYFFSAK